MACSLCKYGAGMRASRWWLWLLLGLLAIYLLMLFSKWRSIEDDVQTRTNTALSDAGYAWATTNQHDRGRDVLLTGSAPSPEALDQAIKVAEDVNGVRIVEHQLSIVPLEKASFGFRNLNDGGIELSGLLPSKAAADIGLNSAKQSYGEMVVDKQLQIGESVEPANWMDQSTPLISLLKGVKEGGWSFDGEHAKVTGIVRNQSDKDQLLQGIREHFDGPFEDTLQVIPYQAPQLDIVSQTNNGQTVITVRGRVASQAISDQILQGVAERVGAGNVVNQLVIDTEVEPVSEFGQLTSGWLGQLKNGALTLADKVATLRGEFPDQATQTSVVHRSQELLATDGYTLEDLSTVRQSPAPAPTVVTAQPEVPSLAPLTPIQLEQIVSCQTQIDTVMQGKKILFATDSTEISSESYELLKGIADIASNCQSSLYGRIIEVNGHTDNVGDPEYNRTLSEQRASAVRTYLVGLGIPEHILRAIGYGETQPIADNDSENGRAINRRIQFNIR